MNLLIITQKVDAEDDLLGFFVDWIKEFAKHFERVVVISLTKGNYDLPANVFVYSLGKELGRSKLRQLFTLLRLLWRFVPKSQGIFAHMSPIFVIVAWPFAFLNRKKIILWYLHRSVTAKLKLAEWFSYKIVTADRTSLRINSKKIIETGHGINIDKFKTERNWSNEETKILSVGRVSPIKNYETLIRACSILKNDPHIKVGIIGRPIMPSDFSYFEKLKQMSGAGSSQIINFIGYVPYTEMSSYYKNANLVINLAPKGGLDKVVLEAMASGCIVLTSNDNFAKYFGRYKDKLVFDFNHPADLALKIRQLNSTNQGEKKEISVFLIKSVEQNHNLINLISKISKLYE